MENAEMAVASAKVEEWRREKLPGMRVLQGLEQIGASSDWYYLQLSRCSLGARWVSVGS